MKKEASPETACWLVVQLVLSIWNCGSVYKMSPVPDQLLQSLTAGVYSGKTTQLCIYPTNYRLNYITQFIRLVVINHSSSNIL